MTRSANKPRVLFLGKGALPHGLGPEGDPRVRILEAWLRPTVVTVGRPWWRSTPGGTRILSLPPIRPPALAGGMLQVVGGLVAIANSLRGRLDAIVCQSALEAVLPVAARRLLPNAKRLRVVVEIHGDWRLTTRLYGSPVRGVASPIIDRVAAWAVRHADRVRAIGSFTAELARNAGYDKPIDIFPTFTDYSVFTARGVVPLPERPHAVYIGSLTRTKGLPGLLTAWQTVVNDLPNASLTLAGEGPLLAQLQAQARRLGISHSVQFVGPLSPHDVSDLLDSASCLVLPSQSEGLGRVILEAFARARSVVASRVGGIPELVAVGERGLLVEPEHPAELAAALVRVLRDRELALYMGERAHAYSLARDPLREYDEGIRRLARWAVDQRAQFAGHGATD